MKKLKELSINHGGVYLCECTNCNSVLIDNNPQVGAKAYEDISDAETKQLVDLTDSITKDVHYFWGCPNCMTDEYLIDV